MSKFAHSAALVFALIVLTASSAALATEIPNNAAPVSAKVIAIGTYANGTHYIMFDRAITGCSTDPVWQGRFNIAANSPSLKTIIALATVAIALNKELAVHPGACESTTNGVIWDVTNPAHNSYLSL